ncbi:MAG: 2-isopropylmalate synthase [Polyangiaceae bacterium]|nr:2-isopropylmalate synthase [Polyangiaceae bacterium]
MSFEARRYRPFPVPDFAARQWPSRKLTKPPIWCSVDLRDGNQALIQPMGPERKLRFFQTLVAIGFKEIEVGFPAASQTDFDFVRTLIEGKHIPEDVTIQVLTQAREHLIERTVESVRGARRAIVHLYNSTSTLQRRVVFGMGRDGIRDLALRGTRWVQEAIRGIPGTEVILEYSPESFTGTELEYACDVTDAVSEIWQPTPERKMIVNLPATVEMATPNVYADQIEWMSSHLARRDSITISVHAHNDRGCAVAASELAMLAGAERVEGTLFGNGERTGNTDVVTVALNLYSQGIDPGLDLHDVPALVKVAEYCNRLPVPARHPYAGELVFTAFSGSHQDAIRKGLEALDRDQNPLWEVPYLPIDPSDIGRVYEPLIRINSQSGKGGVAYVLEQVHGYHVPKDLAIEFSQAVQHITDSSGDELGASDVLEAFEDEYLSPDGALRLDRFEVERHGSQECTLALAISRDGKPTTIRSSGSGPIDALVQGLRAEFQLDVDVIDYSEHALKGGADAEAVAYVRLRGSGGRKTFGVGRNRDIVAASLRAVLSGVNRLIAAEAP